MFPSSSCKSMAPKMAMDQYLYMPFLGGWTSIYQLFWCSPGVQGFDPSPNGAASSTSAPTFRSLFWKPILLFKPRAGDRGTDPHGRSTECGGWNEGEKGNRENEWDQLQHIHVSNLYIYYIQMD
jgi:hypothetical protein